MVNHGKPNKNHPQYCHTRWYKQEKPIQTLSFMALDLPHCSNSGVPGTRSTIPRILRVRLRRQIGRPCRSLKNFPSMPWYFQVTNENGEGSTEITFGTGAITGWGSELDHRCEIFEICVPSLIGRRFDHI